MKDCSLIRKIKVTDSASEVNELLEEYWVLLNIFVTDGIPMFILGSCVVDFEGATA